MKINTSVYATLDHNFPFAVSMLEYIPTEEQEKRRYDERVLIKLNTPKNLCLLKEFKINQYFSHTDSFIVIENKTSNQFGTDQIVAKPFHPTYSQDKPADCCPWDPWAYSLDSRSKWQCSLSDFSLWLGKTRMQSRCQNNLASYFCQFLMCLSHFPMPPAFIRELS